MGNHFLQLLQLQWNLQEKLYSKQRFLINTIKSNIGNKLVSIIKLKKTNICYSIEYTDYDKIIQFIEDTHATIIILQLYSSIIQDLTYDKAMYIKQLSLKYNFLIYENTSFSTETDIFVNEITKKLQMYNWVDIINITCDHNENIYKTIQYINDTHNKELSVVYNSSLHNKLITNHLDRIIVATTKMKFDNICTIGQSIYNDIIIKRIRP